MIHKTKKYAQLFKIKIIDLIALKYNFQRFDSQKMFSNALSATLVLQLFFLSLVEGCQTSIAFGNSQNSCRFIVSYPTGDCYNFSFQECQYQICQEHENGIGCIRYQTTTSTSYSYCTYKCCDPSASYSENWGSIEQCQDYLNDSFGSLVLIFVGVAGGIGLIFGIIAFFVCCFPKLSQSDCDCPCTFSFASCCGSIKRRLKCPWFSRKKANEDIENKSWLNTMIANPQTGFNQITLPPTENVEAAKPPVELNCDDITFSVSSENKASSQCVKKQESNDLERESR